MAIKFAKICNTITQQSRPSIAIASSLIHQPPCPPLTLYLTIQPPPPHRRRRCCPATTTAAASSASDSTTDGTSATRLVNAATIVNAAVNNSANATTVAAIPQPSRHTQSRSSQTLLGRPREQKLRGQRKSVRRISFSSRSNN